MHAAAGTPIQMGSVEQLFAVNVGGVKNVVSNALALGIERIDHGLAIMEDPELVARVADARIPLDVSVL